MTTREEREEQVRARRDLQAEAQSAYDRFLDELAAVEGLPTDIATAAFRVLPDRIGVIADAIHERRRRVQEDQG